VKNRTRELPAPLLILVSLCLITTCLQKPLGRDQGGQIFLWFTLAVAPCRVYIGDCLGVYTQCRNQGPGGKAECIISLPFNDLAYVGSVSLDS
jgi:hypothetical protein